ncbi:MAG: hypothetical protein ACK4N4_14985 [Burkholderiales bacterium]
MLVEFFFRRKEGGAPLSIREFLALLEAPERGVVFSGIDDPE